MTETLIIISAILIFWKFHHKLPPDWPWLSSYYITRTAHILFQGLANLLLKLCNLSASRCHNIPPHISKH